MKTNIYFLIISRQILLRTRSISDKICRENQNTYFMFYFFFPECRLWHNGKTYCTARQGTGDDMAHAHCM